MLETGNYEYLIFFDDSWVDDEYNDQQDRYDNPAEYDEIEDAYNEYVKALQKYIESLNIQEYNTSSIDFIRVEFRSTNIAVYFNLLNEIDKKELLHTIQKTIDYHKYIYFGDAGYECVFNLFYDNRKTGCRCACIACEDEEELNKID